MVKSTKPKPVKNKKDYVEFNLPKLDIGNKSINGAVVLLIVFAFIIGVLTNRVILLEKDLKEEKSAPDSTTNQQPNKLPPEDNGPVNVSIDDDPVLGDSDAPITLIEFSDYECPFCKRYFEQTLPQIKEEYIDTGKVKMVYRDLPLSFHDPLATLQAAAANCAREQGGDSKYFEYHDEIFKRTASNGNGMEEEELYTIASDIGLDNAEFTTCFTNEENKKEITNDLADAGKVGATGTPTFFIGKSTDNGIISGTKLVGAQPFSEFEQIIEGLLEE